MHRTQNICADGFLLLLKAFKHSESKNVIISDIKNNVINVRYGKDHFLHNVTNIELSPVFIIEAKSSPGND